MRFKGYVGTYTSTYSKGIYTFDYENQSITNVKLFAPCKNPKYLTFVNEFIAAICEYENGAGVSLFDKQGNEINQIVFEDTASCFITYQNGYLYTANYHEGTFNVIAVNHTTLKLFKTIKIQDKAGCHQIIPYQDKFLVPCLFLDKVIIISQTYEIIGWISLEAGAGPRHGVFSDDNTYLYLVGELSNFLYVIDMETLKVVNQIRLLENGVDHVKDSAAIRKNGNYLYISTRTQNVISVVTANGKDVKLVQVSATMGDHPRDFVIIEDTLLVANRNTNNLSLLHITDGLIDRHIQTTALAEGIAIIFEEVL